MPTLAVCVGCTIQTADFTTLTEVVLAKEFAGTPLVGQEKAFVEKGRIANVDPFLAAAIAYKESNYARAYTTAFNDECHNPFGLMRDGLIKYKTWADGIDAEYSTLGRMLDHGAVTLSELNVMYAADQNWYIGVMAKYNDLWNQLIEVRKII